MNRGTWMMRGGGGVLGTKGTLTWRPWWWETTQRDLKRCPDKGQPVWGQKIRMNVEETRASKEESGLRGEDGARRWRARQCRFMGRLCKDSRFNLNCQVGCPSVCSNMPNTDVDLIKLYKNGWAVQKWCGRGHLGTVWWHRWMVETQNNRNCEKC